MNNVKQNISATNNMELTFFTDELEEEVSNAINNLNGEINKITSTLRKYGFEGEEWLT